MQRDRIWSKFERLSWGLKHNATCLFSFFNLSYPLPLTLCSHPKKWVVDYSFPVAFKEPSVTDSPKIANVFGGGRSTHFGTEKMKKYSWFCATSGDWFYSGGLSDWPGSLLCPVSQEGLAAKGPWKCQAHTDPKTTVKSIASQLLAGATCTQHHLGILYLVD